MSVMIYLPAAGREGKVKPKMRFIHMTALTGTTGATSRDLPHIVTEFMPVHELYCGPWFFRLSKNIVSLPLGNLSLAETVRESVLLSIEFRMNELPPKNKLINTILELLR